MDRIKGVRKKQSDGSFATLVPFSTDGQLVDMISGLDLEQELKIGGLHNTIIRQVDNKTTSITEQYFNQDKSAIEYTLGTVITEYDTGYTDIEMILSKGQDIIKAKTITIPPEVNNTILISEEEELIVEEEVQGPTFNG